MKDFWTDRNKLAEKIVEKYRELLTNAVRKELEFISILENLDKEQEENESEPIDKVTLV